MDASSSQCPGHVVVALHGELDVCDAVRVAWALSAAAVPGCRVIVDLAGLTFMDCNSLSALAAVRKQALHAGGDLLLAEPRGKVLVLLSLIDPDGVLPVFAGVDEAANGDRSPLAPGWLTAEPAGDAASLGNGEVNRAGSGASAAGLQ